MINNQLLDYIKQQLSLNIGKEVIISNLKSQGWTDADLNEAFIAVGFTGLNHSTIPIPPMASAVTPHSVEFQVKTIHPKSKKMLLFISIFILFIMVGGGAYVYYLSTWVPLSKTKVDNALREIDEARQKGHIAMIKSSLTSLRAYAELFFDTNNDSYLGFCTSQELKDLRKEAEDAGGTDFVCKTTDKEYALGIKLLGNSDNYCVDSTGDPGRITTTLPSGVVCPVN